MSDSLQPKNRTTAQVQLLDSAHDSGSPQDFLQRMADSELKEPLTVRFYLAALAAERLGEFLFEFMPDGGDDPRVYTRNLLIQYGWAEFVFAADASPSLILKVLNDGAEMLDNPVYSSLPFMLKDNRVAA